MMITMLSKNIPLLKSIKTIKKKLKVNLLCNQNNSKRKRTDNLLVARELQNKLILANNNLKNLTKLIKST